MQKIRGVFSFHGIVLVILVVAACVLAGCSQPGTGTAGAAKGPGGCDSAASCAAYCQQHPTECDQFCSSSPASCGGAMGGPSGATAGKGEMGAGTSCANDAIKQKMGTVMSSALVSPPAQARGINWMTKTLPAGGNPFAGTYYVIGTAFGPGVDETGWNGEGAPQYTAGKMYCTFGYWDSVPKGKGATLGLETPTSFSTDKYDLMVFCANFSAPSQAAMTAALPTLTMSEEEARQYFYSVIKKDFINIDGKTMTKTGNMYQLMWKDSTASHDQWEVQIGHGYINVGQGAVNYGETEYVMSLRGQDPGTRWTYHACRPCMNCGKWTETTELNKDCTQASDCMGGLACSSGYCVDPKSAAATSSATAPSSQAAATGAPAAQGTGGPGNTGAPGSSCSGVSDCASGLTCKGGVCAVPGGP